MFGSIKQQFSQARKLIAYSALSFSAQIAGAVLPLLIAKFFTEEEFGSFSLAKMVVFFIATLAVGSTQGAFVVYANEERVNSGKINKSFSVRLFFFLCGVITGGLLFVIFHNPVSRFAGINTTDVVFLFLALAGYSGKIFFCSVFMALDKRIERAIAELAYGIFNVIIIVVFYLSGCLDLRTAFLTFFLSSIMLVLVTFKAVDVKLFLPLQIDSLYLRKMFHFSKWVFLGSTAAYFINWGDNIVLRIFVPLREIGIYSFAYQLFKGLIITTGIISQYFLPFIVSNLSDHSKIKAYLFSKRPKILLAGVIVWIGAFFAIPFAVDLFYGQKYLGSIQVFQILWLAVFMRLYMVFYDPLYNALKRYRFTTVATIVQIAINLLLALAIVPFYGIKGAAVATVAAYFCKLVMFESYYRIYLSELYREN